MNYNTIFVGMDVHKEKFSICCYSIEKDEVMYRQTIPADYRQVLKYLSSMRKVFGEEVKFECGYEAGCLGFSLYRDLVKCEVNCKILAPTTMLQQSTKRNIKTDKRDAEIIAKSLAYNTYSAVNIPTKEDEQVREYLRMREDHKLALKKIKQQILGFCLRLGLKYEEGKNNWTERHMLWLNSLELEGIYKEVLTEYLLTYRNLTDKIERMDKRIEELASEEKYKENVKKLKCFLGIKTNTALSVIVEIGDFKRFEKAEKFSAYIGLVPGEISSGNSQVRTGITKAGNSHVRRLLTEAAQSYGRGKIGFKSKELKARQLGNSAEVISYADKANERLRRKYYKMVLSGGKKANVAKSAIARELACFIWGMMTNKIG